MSKHLNIDLELPKSSFTRDFITNWSFRNLNTSIQKISFIISVSIYYDKCITQEKMQKARDIIYKWKIDKKIFSEPPSGIKDTIYKKMLLNVRDYTKNINIFNRDKNLVLKFLIANIQLYSIVLDIFETFEDKSYRLEFEKILINIYNKKCKEFEY